ncbi:MAG: peptidase U37, partial [Magnetococcales bacterium]|nr:peptidase U37 [Magnetococcales bacterium]
MPTTIDLPMQSRAASFVPGSANAETRTVELVWSTGAAVRRRDWKNEPFDEVLSLDPGHVDLSRLNTGAPLLNTHWNVSLGGVIGVVERAWIDGGVGKALVRFSLREDVADIFKDVCDGILRNISVGYSVRQYEVTAEPGQVPQWRAIDWIPLELSVVPVGADPGAGFRASESNLNPCLMIPIRGANMSDPTTPQAEPEKESVGEVVTRQTTPPQPQEEAVAKPVDAAQKGRFMAPEDPEIAIRQAIVAERERSAQIYEAQEKLKVHRSVADKLVQDGVTLDEARRSLIDEAFRNSGTSHAIRHHVAISGQDEKTTRRAALENALLHRFDPTAHTLSDAAREWRGLTLVEMARIFLEADGGQSTRGLSRYDVATRALLTGSDFPNILANVANKTLRNAYDTAPRTFQPFCRQVTANDFKAMTRVQLGEA